ncbi:MAG: protease inhibitor I42 family protein [Acidimicrobiia bacterium]
MPRSLCSVAFTVAMAVLALGGISACGGGGGGEDASGPSVYTRSGETISVEVGEEFVILLESNPSTGYEWSVTEQPPEVRLVSQRYDPPAEQIPGRGGQEELRFAARKAGRATLELVYARSFEPDVPPAETATFELRIG